MMSVKSWLSLFVTFVALNAVRTQDETRYCSQQFMKLCQGKGTHVGCQFPSLGPGQSCTNYTPIKFNGALKDTVLEFINKRRQRIAAGKEKVKDGARIPKSKVMMYVEWDNQLADLAQRLADQCTFTHDDCRATPKYPYAGQNVGEVLWKNPKDSDSLSFRNAIKGILNAWYSERKRALPHQVTGPFKISAKGVSWGHFSQLAVWTLRAVGCGAVRYGERNHMRLLLVCDFSHNNMIGQKTVNAGAQVSCPTKTARRMFYQYPLLCAPIKANQDDEEDDDSPKESPPEREQNTKPKDEDYHERSPWMEDFWRRLMSGQLVSMSNVSVLTEKMFAPVHEIRERLEDREETQKSKDKDEDENLYNSRSQGQQENRKKNSMESRRRKLEEDDVQYPRNNKPRRDDNLRASNDHIESDSDMSNSDDEDYSQSKSEEHGNRDEHSERRDEDNHVVHTSLDEEDERKAAHPVESRKKNTLESRRRKFKDEEEFTKKAEKPRYFVKFRSNNAEREINVREKPRSFVDDDEDDHLQPQHRKESSDRLRENQRRDRPERPGALALQTDMPQGKPAGAKQQRPGFSGNMDKEDLDQLFHDTGFQIPKQG